MDHLRIERRGGLTGLRARAEVDMESLAPADRAAVEALFRRRGALPKSPGADRFVYAVTRVTSTGPRTLLVPEELIPRGLAALVHDELP